jgi:hypothetical protein
MTYITPPYPIYTEGCPVTFDGLSSLERQEKLEKDSDDRVEIWLQWTKLCREFNAFRDDRLFEDAIKTLRDRKEIIDFICGYSAYLSIDHSMGIKESDRHITNKLRYFLGYHLNGIFLAEKEIWYDVAYDFENHIVLDGQGNRLNPRKK